MYKHFCMLCVLLLVALLVAQVQAAPNPQRNLAPTLRIFATREGLVGQTTANGHVIQERDHFVALPSWRVLSSYHGYEYQVRITYNGRSVVVPVWDVGPWNTDDNYWSYDRGQYTDLPIGIPQAQAAFYEGYNGGLDEFGRRINNPNGIDIADGTFWDDLGMTRNDWVNVSFLWLGEDPGPGAAVEVPAAPPPSAQPPAPGPQAPPAQTTPVPPGSTPQPLDSPSADAGATVVDNDESGYNGGSAEWQTAPCGLHGNHQWVYGDPGSIARATWSPSLTTGAYEVRVYIPLCGEGIATTAAHYAVVHDRGHSEIVIDQAAATGSWVSMGTYSFGRVSTPAVELRAATDDTGRVVRFDAIEWIPILDNNPPQARVLKIVRERNGYRLEWGGLDDLSGIATYDVQVRQLPNGSWRAWVNNLEVTSAWFGPDEGRQFAFRVRARDWAGNEQSWSEANILDTTQVPPAQP